MKRILNSLYKICISRARHLY